MKLPKLTLLFLCCLLSTKQYCQTNQYVFSHINFNNGLSNNHVNCFYKDVKGFMWIGTQSGLNRYDGYKIKQFKYNPQDTGSISDNNVYQIFEAPNNRLWIETGEGRFNIYDAAREKFDRNYAAYLRSLSLPETWLSTILKGKNSYWFVYPDIGLFRYMPGGKIVAIKHAANNTNTISADKITDVKEDSFGNLWVIHENGLLEKIDGITNKIVYRTGILSKTIPTNKIWYSLFIDAQNDVWLYAGAILNGAFCFNPQNGLLRHLSQDAGGVKLSSNFIYSIAQDEKGFIWLVTDHGGINVINKNNFSVTNILHSEADPKSLPENTIGAIFKDNLNIIWLGTSKKGISFYHENIIKFPQYRHQPADPASLSYDDINSFAEDALGNVWIGSNGGGLIYFNRKTNTFSKYLHDAGNAASICSNIIVSLLLDRDNRLWIGTYFGGLDCYDGKSFTHYKHSDSLPGSIADDRVMALYEDENNDLWIGTLGEGVDKFDRRQKTFLHYKSSNSNSIVNNYISSIAQDAGKNLWIATAYGIDVLENRTGKFIHYSSEGNLLSNNNVICLFKDSGGNMWAGTREGLNLFNPAKKTFRSFRLQDGLSDNTIRSILEDDKHDIWAGTANGLTKINLLASGKDSVNISCKKYAEQDGLQGREFNEKAALKMRSGEFVFGGQNGFNIFKPASITNSQGVPSIVFTDLQVFNESIQPGVKTGNHIILDKSIIETGQITLNYSENVFSVAFASLDFINTARYKYAYMLEGFNKNWLTTDDNLHKANFTNLDAGEYTLRVRVADEDGVWNKNEAALKIIILPPLWKTPVAYLLYVLVLAGILYAARRMVVQKERLRFELENERLEAQRIHAMDKVKIRFFTNMSHELRTPLSLIMAPAEKLLNSKALPDTQKQYEMINRNAKRLLNLVNQLLDFRKMEVNQLRLHPSQGDIIKFIEDTATSFTDLAEKKNISFSFNSEAPSLITSFDHDKIERILFNLLSNAFKFTPENGIVEVEVQTGIQQNKDVLLQIKVIDNGIGIPPHIQDKIFNRFFQSEVPDTILNHGSGIGLSITKEFIKMHGGNITVTSEEDSGTCFTITLPFKKNSADTSLLTAGEAAQEKTDSAQVVKETMDDHEKAMPGAGSQYAHKNSVLIVEDNEDFRFYLKDNLKVYYNIIEAANGKEGWQKCLALHPGLVVSDISMPVMDGIELCKKIKADERTNQIPVILLTAFAGEGQELKGLKTGASDYLTKPFNFEILLSKMNNLLRHNETVKKTYQKQVQVKQAALEIESADDKLIQQVLELIEKNMGNPDFSVEELSKEIHCSRATLYKKLLLLTGKTPIEFIRHIRLQRAAQLLEKTQMTVAEIAYHVGFNSPKYFAQYFKVAFDVVPTAYRLQKTGKTNYGTNEVN